MTAPNPSPTAPAEREPDPAFWRARRILVTGGGGFLGSHVVDRLRALGAADVAVPRRAACDLTEQSEVRRLFREARPDLVLHLAAEVGGIGANRMHPGRFFYANAMMGVMVIEEARRAGVEKLVQVGTVCGYPKHTPVPFRETDFWIGYPEETNAPYGVAKKALSVQLSAYRDEYGFRSAYVLPTNLYGPRDNFDPASSHVVPALVRRMVEAKRAGAPRLEVWGTGSASREFLYVDDCARALLLAAEHLDDPEPVNVGNGSEVTIRDLVGEIARVVGWEGEVVWDASRPDGQPRRCLDTARALERFGFRARVPFHEGLRATVDWYLASGDGRPADAPAAGAAWTA